MFWFLILLDPKDDLNALGQDLADKFSTTLTPKASARKENMPVCLHCPNPQFSQAAVEHHVEGSVLLLVVIGVDGRAREIDIQNPVFYQLTEKAIEAVQTWTFKPATSADGTAVEVLTPIEVTFRFTQSQLRVLLQIRKHQLRHFLQCIEHSLPRNRHSLHRRLTLHAELLLQFIHRQSVGQIALVQL